MLYHMLYTMLGLPPMLSTMLYTTYSVYHARMGGVAVLDEILDKLSIDLFLPGEVFYNTPVSYTHLTLPTIYSV